MPSPTNDPSAGWGSDGFGLSSFGVPSVGWGSGGFGNSIYGGTNPTQLSAGSEAVSFVGVVVATGSANLELTGATTPSISGSVNASSSAIAFIPATEAGIFLPVGLVTGSGSASVDVSGVYSASGSNPPSIELVTQALISGAAFQAQSGIVLADVIVNISITEFAELFWQDPRAVTLSKFLIGGGGGIPNSTGSNRSLIDMILTHPKALTSAKLLALGD